MSEHITVVAEKDEYFPEDCFRRYSYVDEKREYNRVLEEAGMGSEMRTVDQLNYGCVMEDGSGIQFKGDEDGNIEIVSWGEGIDVALNRPLVYEGHISDMEETPSDVVNNIDYYSRAENISDLDWAVRKMEADLISSGKTGYFDCIRERKTEDGQIPDHIEFRDPD